MRERLQAWAEYFAGVGIALWAAAGILFLLGNQPAERLLALGVIGALLLGVYVYFRFTQVRSAVTSREARYGSNALVMTVAFLGIVGLLNFLGTRYYYRQDLTANQAFTLSPLTIQVLQGLKEPVTAWAFYSPTLNPQMQQEAQDRLNEYKRYTDKLSYQFVDWQANPQLALDYKVQYDGTIVFERGKRREIATSDDEETLTNALLKVSQDTQPTIYMTTGHGEHAPQDSGDNGYSMIVGALEAENFKIEALDLKTLTETMPSNISVLVIAGPRQPFDPQEVQRVDDYLAAGGRALIMLDPQTQTGLEEILAQWGIRARNDAVIDPRYGFFGQTQVPVINTYRYHEITKDLAGLSSFFPSARSLTTESITTTRGTPAALFSTSDLSWGETDFASLKNQNPKLDSGVDAKGPLDLAYAVEASNPADTTKPTRLVAFGNSLFVTNGTLNTRINVGGQATRIQSGNGLLFFNSIKWLAGQENLIAISPKTAENRMVFLTAEQSAFVFWSSFLLLPVAVLIIGALVWWRRR